MHGVVFDVAGEGADCADLVRGGLHHPPIPIHALIAPIDATAARHHSKFTLIRRIAQQRYYALLFVLVVLMPL